MAREGCNANSKDLGLHGCAFEKRAKERRWDGCPMARRICLIWWKYAEDVRRAEGGVDMKGILRMDCGDRRIPVPRYLCIIDCWT